MTRHHEGAMEREEAERKLQTWNDFIVYNLKCRIIMFSRSPKG
jgi:hypothetical protein